MSKIRVQDCFRMATTFSLLTLGGLILPASALPWTIAQLNPSPSIFNEPPYNRNPRPTTQPAPVLTPATDPIEAVPEATISPVEGKISVTLNNQTSATINYQVIGDTQYRTLAGRSQISLQDLSLPMTLTFRREDGGLLQPVLLPGDTPGTLDLNLSEATDLSVDRLSLVVDEAGQAFLR